MFSIYTVNNWLNARRRFGIKTAVIFNKSHFVTPCAVGFSVWYWFPCCADSVLSNQAHVRTHAVLSLMLECCIVGVFTVHVFIPTYPVVVVVGSNAIKIDHFLLHICLTWRLKFKLCTGFCDHIYISRGGNCRIYETYLLFSLEVEFHDFSISYRV
jgi:hypothetical protein